MPRRSILSTAERESLLALPDAKDDLIRYYTFSDNDLSVIRQHRGPANRLGFAVQLCYLRFPGVILGALMLAALPEVLRYVAGDIQQMTDGRIDASILRQLLVALAMITVMLVRPRGLWPAPEHGKSAPVAK